MSMHKVPLTKLERDGLEAHHLAIGTPSQLSDCFRSGVQWAEEYYRKELEKVFSSVQLPKYND